MPSEWDINAFLACGHLFIARVGLNLPPQKFNYGFYLLGKYANALKYIWILWVQIYLNIFYSPKECSFFQLFLGLQGDRPLQHVELSVVQSCISQVAFREHLPGTGRRCCSARLSFHSLLEKNELMEFQVFHFEIFLKFLREPTLILQAGIRQITCRNKEWWLLKK